MERDPYYETTQEWFYEEEIDGCLHGVPWDEDCWECELEEHQMDMGVF